MKRLWVWFRKQMRGFLGVHLIRRDILDCRANLLELREAVDELAGQQRDFREKFGVPPEGEVISYDVDTLKDPHGL